MKARPVQIKPAALRLLLYAHEVVLDSQEIYSDFNPYRRRLPVSRADELKLWVRMRPIVEDGSVKLAPLSRPNQTVVDDVEKLMASPAIQVYLERMWEEIQPAMPYVDDATRSVVTSASTAIGVERLVGFAAFRAISGASRLAASQKAHTLALDVLDQVVLRILVQRPVIGRRHMDLQKLAAFEVPSMTGNVSSLVELRQSSADFAEWRRRLGEAMSYVGDLGENEASVEDAAEVVYAQLSDGQCQLGTSIAPPAPRNFLDRVSSIAPLACC
jgi:hypothetical protein